MKNELDKLQEERGRIYGSFNDHCFELGKVMKVKPIEAAMFYVESKKIRWENCRSIINRDSAVDLLSYIDLIEKNFSKNIIGIYEKRLVNLKKEFIEILERIDREESL